MQLTDAPMQLVEAPVVDDDVDYLARAKAIAPLIEAEAETAEAQTDVTDAVGEALREQGLFWMFVPRHYGGGQTDLVTATKVLEEISRADGSTGWVLMATSIGTRNSSFFLPKEGADELFLGYDLFKETKLRHFCLRQPESTRRPRLFDRLYPYLNPGNKGGDFWRGFFLSAGGPEDPLFSHLPRFALTSRIKDFYSASTREALGDFDPMQELRESLPEEFSSWSPLNRAAYLEITTLLSSYLLSSQGDRMAMAHGVEGRFPFLDHRLFRFSADLPVRSKLRGLREKEILRRWAASVVPPTVAQRPKQPYRAPDIPAFFAADAPEYVRDALSPEALLGSGLFEPAAVAGLVRR